MKKLKLFISLWFTMFSIVVFGQAEYEKIAITQNTQDNTAGRLLVQDVTTGEVRWILKSILDNKFNQPTGNATQYLDGAGNPTTFPVLSQSDRVITEVRNSTGATITKGTVVYLNGATGGKPNVQKAQANAEATSSGTFGVIQSDINNNSNGYVVVIGTVLGLNTSAYTAGQVLWLSPTTAGGFTTTKPVAPNHAVYVGIVTLAATQGTIEVKIQNGYELDEIHDVLITSKTDNDGLIYDAMSGLWKNKQITKAMVGLANVDNTSDLNKPISTATQTALNLKENTANKNTANGYAGLGSDGKLISSQLPAITITDTFVVGSQAAMLALTAETGDVAVRTDVNKSFILKGTSAGTLADWQELLTPTSSVTSVFGRQGAVTANNGDYTTSQVTETTNKKYQTDNQALYNDATSSIQTQLNGKEPSISSPGTTGQYWRGNKTWATLDTSVIPENGPLFYTDARARAAVSLTTTGTSGAATYSSSTGVLNIPNYTTGVGGSGTTNYISKFTGASTLGNSQIFDNGTNVGIGTASPNNLLHIEKNQNTYTSLRLRNNDAGSSAYAMLGINAYGNSWGMRMGSSAANSNSLDFVLDAFGTPIPKMTIASNGRVGIGTIAPNTTLQVAGESSAASFRLSPSTGSYENYRLDIRTEAADAGALRMSFNDNNFLKTYGYYFLSGLSLGVSGYEDLLHLNNGGKVGIGTTSPSQKLTVAGNISVGTTLPLIFSNDLTEPSLVNGIYSTTDNTGYGFAIGKMVSGVKTKQLIINDNGDVGIGVTPASSYKLYVAGGQYGTYLRGGDLGTGSAALNVVKADNSSSLYVRGDGNVGINETAPSEKLTINSGNIKLNSLQATPGQYRFIGSEYSTGNGNNRAEVRFGIDNSDTNTFLSFATAAGAGTINERMKIYSNGNIAKLTSTGFDGNFDNIIKYGTAPDLNSGNSNANRWIGIDATVTAGAAVTNALRIRAYGGGTGNAAPVNVADFRGDQSAVFYGSVTATGFFQSSDLRLKDIISRDGDVIKYKWKDKRDDKIHIGYVAQEVQKENPDQVNADDKGILSVNYIEILVQKIKDLENRIKQLEK